MIPVDEIFDEVTAAMINEVADSSGVDSTHLIGPVISIASAMTGRGLTIAVPKVCEGYFSSNSILWFLSLAYSGFGKTPAVRSLTKAMRMSQDLVNLRLHGFYKDGIPARNRLWTTEAKHALKTIKATAIQAGRNRNKEKQNDAHQSVDVQQLPFVLFLNFAGRQVLRFSL